MANHQKDPVITVITVVFNCVSTLEVTIDSVINQSFKNFEYIVIDGGSTDGTVDILKKHDKNIDFWVSEPDKGIYDAMNKGIDKANGLYTVFVNAGDYLYDDKVFEKIFSESNELLSFDMIYGRSKIISERGDIKDLVVHHTINELWRGPCFRHGALFAKTSLLKENKFELSEELKIAADFDFIYKINKNKYKFKALDVIVVAFLEDGVSNNPYKHIKDTKYILKRHGDWNNKTRFYYLYRYSSLLISKSPLKYLYKVLRIFFQNYLANYWINKVPFYFVRHQYYKKILGIHIGKGSSIHLNCFLYGTNIYIAENSTVNRNCYLDGRGKLYIGSNVSISPDVHIITEDHNYNSINFTGRTRDVFIDDYVWIGTRATILPGVRISKGAVVCAGAVVTKNVAEYDVVGGVPAVKIKERSKNLDYNPSWMPFFH